MKPSDIIYWNQLSGLTETFSKTDMRYKKIVNLFGRKYATDGILKKLFIDRTLQFSMRNPEMLCEPFALFAYMMSTPEIRRKEGKNTKVICDIDIVEETDDYLEIRFTEYINEVVPDTPPLAYIKFERNLKEKVNGLSGKIAVIIHDVRSPGGTQTTNSALGAMALALGAYIGGVFDGYWERITNKYKDIYEDNSQEIISSKTRQASDLEFRLKQLAERYAELKKHDQEEIARLEKSLRIKSAALKEYAQKLAHFRKALEEAQKAAGPSAIKIANPIITAQQSEVDKFTDAVIGLRVAVVGGSSSWKAKLEELPIDFSFLDENRFDENVVRNSELLIINTGFTGHSITNRAKQIAQANDIKVVITSKSNMTSMAKDILEQLN